MVSSTTAVLTIFLIIALVTGVGIYFIRRKKGKSIPQHNTGATGGTEKSRADCSGHGNPQTCSSSGEQSLCINEEYSCQCDPGYAGNICQFSRELSCNSQGSPANCSTTTGSTGGTTFPLCNTGDFQCNCDFGVTGSNCQFTDQSQCSGNGHTDYGGNCTCVGILDGDTYQCNPNSECIGPIVGTNCQWVASTQCNGNATTIEYAPACCGVDQNWNCGCGNGTCGQNCQYTYTNGKCNG